MVRYTKRLPKLESYECKSESFAVERNFWFVHSSNAKVPIFLFLNLV